MPGVWRFSVWARDASSAGTNGTAPNTYDSFSAFDYTLATCSAVTASAAPATSANVGTPVAVTASATGCTSANYQFWLLPPGGTWSVVQGYSANATYNWNTTGKAPGVYRFSVWARDASSPGTAGTGPNTYDVFSAFNYTLSAVPCTSASASAAPPTSASRGTQVSVPGSGIGCPNPQYEFWLLAPGATWTLAQGWSSNATFVWSTSAGQSAGTYRFSVWTRDASSSGTNGTAPYTYDAFSAFNYTLT
jgi:hypothetical protein